MLFFIRVLFWIFKESLKNIFIQIFPISVIEIVRSVLVVKNKNNKFIIIFITILLILIEINYNTLINLYSNKEEFFKYVCEAVYPLIACSILCTYLSLIRTYSLSLIYRIFKEVINILLPILPNTDWFVRGTVSILSTFIIYILFKYKINKEEKKDDAKRKKETFFSKIVYISTLILCIGLVCFMLGVFKYEPITILSNSMIPTFSRSDVVIYKKLTENELKEIPDGSIIIYSIEEQNIAHRVVDRKIVDNTIEYQTKGDSNNIADTNLVKVNQIIYIFHIKYIGFPSVFLYEYFNSERAKVETK